MRRLPLFFVFLFAINAYSFRYAKECIYLCPDLNIPATIVQATSVYEYPTNKKIGELLIHDSVTISGIDFFRQWHLIKLNGKLGIIPTEMTKDISDNDSCENSKLRFIADTSKISVNEPVGDTIFYSLGDSVYIIDSTNTDYITVSRENLVLDTISKKSISTTHKQLSFSADSKTIYHRYSYCKQNKLTKATFKDIFEGNVKIGMTKKMVIASWGEPEDINRTVTKYGSTEQWVYGSTYIYFENGVLSSFQD